MPVLREQFENRVFQPGYNMATMSIEEAGEIDYMEMLERTEREKQSAARKVCFLVCFVQFVLIDCFAVCGVGRRA
jgi:hypothetical protein